METSKRTSDQPKIWKKKKSRINYRHRSLSSNSMVFQETEAAIAKYEPIVFQINQNTTYLFIRDLRSNYTFLSDVCCHLKLIPFSHKYRLNCEGYIAKYNESISLSTCFDHKVIIEFKSNPNPIEEINLSKLTRSSFPFLTIIDFEALLNGEAVLLEVNFDHEADRKYKITVEYMSYSNHNMVEALCKLKLSYIHAESSTILTKNDKKEILSQYFQKMENVYYSLELNSKDIVLICGPNNCGKSSLINSLINRYISENLECVAYMECDPGQTQFSPCGILSLVRINRKISNGLGYEFLFGQNSADFNCIESKIYGTISPSSNSWDYISLIEQMYERFNNLQPNIPLFINTMGWVEKLGLELLVKIIAIVNPTHVIRIRDEIDKNCTIWNFTNSLGKFNKIKDLSQLFAMKKTNRFNLWLVSLKIPSLFSSSHFKISSVRREINQIMYMVTNLWPAIVYKPLYVIKPIKISLSNLYIYLVNHPLVIEKSFHDILNLSWIFLGHINPSEDDLISHVVLEKENSLSNNRIKIVQQFPKYSSFSCIGCGIVRNVDVDDDSSIFVTMPSSTSCSLMNPERINFLVLPNQIPIPSGFLIEQFLYQNSCSLPYIHIANKQGKNS